MFLSAGVLKETSSLLETARTMKEYMEYLGFAYIMTEDDKYFNKAMEQMDACASFLSWNPSHFLDTAEMTYAMAIGYDWFYNRMDAVQRNAVKEAIVEKGLKPGEKEYNPETRTSTWPLRTNNWAQVCHCSMIVGALAVMHEEPELASYIIENGVTGLKAKGIPRYADDGSYFEGPDYWSYSTEYLFQAIAALESSVGTDMGLSESESLKNTGTFGVLMNGPAGSFSFNDSGSDTTAPEMLGYMAYLYNKPELFWFRKNSNASPHPYDLIWYSEKKALMPKDAVFHSGPMFTARSDNEIMGGEGIWTAIKGQKGTYDRMDLDCGSFMLDAAGERWALDLGSTSYSVPNYWDCSNNGGRYWYYKKRAEGHNTIVINPDTDADQIAQCNAPIIKTESNSDRTFAVVNLQPAYGEKTVSAYRGLKLYDNRSRVIVQDEIEFSENSEFYWFMNTDAAITLTDDGKTAYLDKNGKRLTAKLISDNESLKFSKLPSLPLCNTPADTSLQKINKLTVHGAEVDSLKMGVVFTLSSHGEITEDRLASVIEWN